MSTAVDYEDAADDILEDDENNLNDETLDSDEDGLRDRLERNTYGTDPYDEDTDGDGMTDGYEVEAGLNPLDSGDAGIEDIITETETDSGDDNSGTDETWPDPDNGPLGDPDKDGLVNAAEKYFGTDPNLPDRQPLTIGIENEEAVIRWPNPQNSGHSVRVMLSADFHHWEASSYTVIRSTDDDGLPIDFMEVHLPLNQSRKIYARLEIGEE